MINNSVSLFHVSMKDITHTCKAKILGCLSMYKLTIELQHVHRSASFRRGKAPPQVRTRQ